MNRPMMKTMISMTVVVREVLPASNNNGVWFRSLCYYKWLDLFFLNIFHIVLFICNKRVDITKIR